MSGISVPVQVVSEALGAAQSGRLRAALPGEGPGLVWEHEAAAFQTVALLAGQAWTPTMPPIEAPAMPPSGLPAWFDAPLPTGLMAVLGFEMPAFVQPDGLAEAWPARLSPVARPDLPPAVGRPDMPQASDNPDAPPRAEELPAPLFPAPEPAGGLRLTLAVVEGTEEVVHRPTVTDRGAEGLGWRIIGGADAALLWMDPASGALGFRSAPDFEQPGDADGDNAYEVVFEVRDGWGAAAAQHLTLLVTDASESPPPPAEPDPLWG